MGFIYLSMYQFNGGLMKQLLKLYLDKELYAI